MPPKGSLGALISPGAEGLPLGQTASRAQGCSWDRGLPLRQTIAPGAKRLAPWGEVVAPGADGLSSCGEGYACSRGSSSRAKVFFHGAEELPRGQRALPFAPFGPKGPFGASGPRGAGKAREKPSAE